jgi:hypothetical protein
MPRVPSTKENELKRAIRDEVIIDPLISLRRLQKSLYNRGFKTASDTPLDLDFISGLAKKIYREARAESDDSIIEERMTATRERFRMATERLFKIAFWNIEYLKEGIMMPKITEQIAAINALTRIDLALLQAEMDAGMFKRHLGTLELEQRSKPLDPEYRNLVMNALKAWGVKPPQSLIQDGNSNNITQQHIAGTPSTTGLIVVGKQ